MHGDQDPYFPPEHARQLYLAAREPKELWLIPGMGHAEVACGNDLIDRIARWLDHAARDPAALNDAAAPVAALDAAAPPVVTLNNAAPTRTTAPGAPPEDDSQPRAGSLHTQTRVSLARPHAPPRGKCATGGACAASVAAPYRQRPCAREM